MDILNRPARNTSLTDQLNRLQAHYFERNSHFKYSKSGISVYTLAQLPCPTNALLKQGKCQRDKCCIVECPILRNSYSFYCYCCNFHRIGKILQWKVLYFCKYVQIKWSNNTNLIALKVYLSKCINEQNSKQEQVKQRN